MPQQVDEFYELCGGGLSQKVDALTAARIAGTLGDVKDRKPAKAALTSSDLIRQSRDEIGGGLTSASLIAEAREMRSALRLPSTERTVLPPPEAPPEAAVEAPPQPPGVAPQPRRKVPPPPRVVAPPRTALRHPPPPPGPGPVNTPRTIAAQTGERTRTARSQLPTPAYSPSRRGSSSISLGRMLRLVFIAIVALSFLPGRCSVDSLRDLIPSTSLEVGECFTLTGTDVGDRSSESCVGAHQSEAFAEFNRQAPLGNYPVQSKCVDLLVEVGPPRNLPADTNIYAVTETSASSDQIRIVCVAESPSRRLIGQISDS